MRGLLILKCSRMLTGLQYHFRCAGYCLGRKGVCLGSRKAKLHCAIRQCLNKLVYISRRASAGADHRAHHPFFHIGVLSDCSEDLMYPVNLFLTEFLRVKRQPCHTLANQSRGVGHSPYNPPI